MVEVLEVDIMAIEKVDPLSDKFHEYLEEVLTKPEEVERLRAEIGFYFETVIASFTEEEIKNMCLTKSIKGAKEHGPVILEKPELVEREKLLEVLDLIIYTVIGEWQEINK